MAQHVKKHHIPITIVAGCVEDDVEKFYNCGVTSIFNMNRKAVDFQISKHYSNENLDNTMDAILQLLKQ
ncbi:MAG: glycerate kinase [Lachnospiraceae bacterium]